MAAAHNALPADRLAYSLQFVHLDKVYGRLPGWDDATVAAVWGIAPETLADIKAGFAQAAERTARELLDEPDFAAHLKAWPMPADSTIAVIGDSYVDDWQSWCEMLSRALRLAVPERGYTLLNAGFSGDTTADAIMRFMRVVPQKPDYVIAAVGTNDARLHGLHEGVQPLISPHDTARNLEALRRLAAAQLSVKGWWWLTPGQVIEERMRKHWYLSPGQVWVRNRDLDVIADIVCAREEPVLDLRGVIGTPAESTLLMDDGLHPSLEGHKAIARAVAKRLISAT